MSPILALMPKCHCGAPATRLDHTDANDFRCEKHGSKLGRAPWATVVEYLAAGRRRTPPAESAGHIPVARGRSGTPWTEDQRAARGRGRMTLRMSLEAHEMLAEQAEGAGCSPSERVEELIRDATARRPK